MNLIRFTHVVPSSLKRRGIAAVEFGLALPIWIILFLGVADLSYCLLVNQRVERIAYSVCDIVTQSSKVTVSDLNNTLLAAGQLMQPFAFGNKGVVIVTSVYKPTGLSPTIEWQYTGGGSLVRSSQIGNIGMTPSLPNGLTLNDNDNVILAEVYYNFSPLFVNLGLVQASDIYRVTAYKPRLSPLITPPT